VLPISDDMLLVIGVSGFVLFFVIYVIYKDSALNKKLRSYEFALEELNRQIYVLEKKQKKSLDESITKTNENLQDHTQHLLNTKVTQMGQNIIESVSELQENQDYMQQEMYSRIEHLENKFNEYLAVPNKTTLDEKRVIALAGAGYTAAGIARELHANLSEVTFILNLHKNSHV
jgi:uncharacterized protein YoxC